jgi:hypothetical protein
MAHPFTSERCPERLSLRHQIIFLRAVSSYKLRVDRPDDASRLKIQKNGKKSPYHFWKDTSLRYTVALRAYCVLGRIAARPSQGSWFRRKLSCASLLSGAWVRKKFCQPSKKQAEVVAISGKGGVLRLRRAP